MTRRLHKYAIPSTPSKCGFACVYVKNGVCEDPRIHNGNSDATCFKFTNKRIIEHLALMAK